MEIAVEGGVLGQVEPGDGDAAGGAEGREGEAALPGEAFAGLGGGLEGVGAGLARTGGEVAQGEGGGAEPGLEGRAEGLVGVGELAPGEFERGDAHGGRERGGGRGRGRCGRRREQVGDVERAGGVAIETGAGVDEVDLLEAPGQAAEGGERGEVDVELVPAGELGAVVGGDGEAAHGEGARQRVDAYLFDGDRAPERGRGVPDGLLPDDDRGEEEPGERVGGEEAGEPEEQPAAPAKEGGERAHGGKGGAGW